MPSNFRDKVGVEMCNTGLDIPRALGVAGARTSLAVKTVFGHVREDLWEAVKP